MSILLGNGAGSFSAATNFGVGSAPSSVAVGDFNGDGKQDLAVANGLKQRVDLVGRWRGQFQRPHQLRRWRSPFSVAVGDFNGDGKQDLAAANYFANNVSILLRDCAVPPTLGNYPDTSLPLSTDATVTPDATPTNTTSITVSTSTDFEGTLEADPMTGVVRVTDAHPAGTYTVTVTAFNSVGETATKTFTLTVTTPATCSPVSFAAATNLAVGDFPQSVAVGDFNGDGKQDLAVANFRAYYAVSVSILLGDGSGNFSAVTNFDSGNGPTSVAVGDFNGDGKQDLAVANQDTNDVSILLGNGDGSFQPAVRFSAGTNPTSVTVGDFNGDGKQDLAVTNSSSNDVSILLGNGDGSLQPAVNLAAGGAPQSVAVGDFNGDGKQDLAVADAGASPDWNGDVSILLGNGDGTFSAPTNLRPWQFSLLSSGGRFQWRWQARPGRNQQPLRQRVDPVGQWRWHFQRRYQLRHWHWYLRSSGGRFQWRRQARPRRNQLRRLSI